MADLEISKIRLPGSTDTYSIKDATARSMASSGFSFEISWDGNSTPVENVIPAGVSVTYGGTVYTGTRAAGSDTLSKFFLVATSVKISGDVDEYDEYITISSGGNYSWEKIGNTRIDLSKLSLVWSASTANVITSINGIEVAQRAATITPSKTNVIGTGATFSYTAPTVTLSPTTTYLKATASGLSIGASGTDSALTAVTPGTGSAVNSISTTKANLQTSTITPLATTSQAITQVASTSNVTATHITANGTSGTQDSFTTSVTSEVLTFSFTPGTLPTLPQYTNVTGTKVTTESVNVAKASNAVTVATGALTVADNGAIITSVTGGTGSFINSIDTSSGSGYITGVQVTAQPAISLSTDATSATGRVKIVTSVPTSATVTGGSVAFNNTDAKSVVTGITSAYVAGTTAFTVNTSSTSVLAASTTASLSY